MEAHFGFGQTVENNNVKTVLFLLKNGADPNYGNGIADHTLEKLMPLEIAAEQGAYMSAERLLSHGAQIDQSILYRTIASGGRYTWVCGERAGGTRRLDGECIDHERTVRVIFDYGAILDDLNTIWSPLHEAVKSYYYPCNGVIKWLLDHGAEVNSKDVSGRSLMFYAFKTEYRNSYQRSKKMVELLLEYRAEPSPEELGEHLFGSQYSFEMTKLLLDLGADVNMLNHDGMTPLHLLLSALDCNGHFEQLEPEEEERFTRLFISHGADVLLKDRESNTPLHLALDPRTLANANRVKQLLDAGAKVLCQSEDGFDPLLALLDDWPDLPYPDDDFDASNPRDLLCQELNRDWDLKTKEVNEMINAFVGFDHPTYILGDIDPLVAQHFPALDPFIPEEAKKEAREAREEEERKARQEKEEEKEEEEYTNKNPASQKVTEVH